MSCCESQCGGDTGQSSILFNILNRDPQCREDPSAAAAHPHCSCAPKRKLVTVRSPQVVLKAASEVLLKTFRFVKNIPCFRGLPAPDQLRLVRNSWAPLLVLGMVQDRVDFDTVESREPSLLHRILTHSRDDEPGVAVGDVDGIKLFVVKCRGLKISVKEYAFLKGAILFNSEVMDLECRDYIRALHREAERALFEHVKTVHRYGCLRALLSTVRSLNPEAVGKLFLRPTSGTTTVDEHVLAAFYER
ncbi:nuclear receptor subfamily 0 group B member 1-like [Sphaeramia orbicularis]|uniref:Nuclear receptor subfamily 0 group B member 1-like n=1 Tax=Sphaeramia orbicularis TaxID=375764 RepID=A0A673BPQ5_9TELE|nr:nuclear receptor subfamily 0 group B member 1-like [Sphaeramia orbicularis]